MADCCDGPEDTAPGSSAPGNTVLSTVGAGDLVCFCFDHTRAAIEAAPQAIEQDIVARCRRGESNCKELNPSGRCCLGDVRKLTKGAG